MELTLQYRSLVNMVRTTTIVKDTIVSTYKVLHLYPQLTKLLSIIRSDFWMLRLDGLAQLEIVESSITPTYLPGMRRFSPILELLLWLLATISLRVYLHLFLAILHTEIRVTL